MVKQHLPDETKVTALAQAGQMPVLRPEFELLRQPAFPDSLVQATIYLLDEPLELPMNDGRPIIVIEVLR